MKGERIVFIGESRMSREMLLTLLKAKKNVVAVFSRYEREGMDDCDDLSDVAANWGIKYWRIEQLNPHAEGIAWYRPTLIYCIGFRQVIKRPILDICPIIAYHPGPLPLMRGHHPIVWALINKLPLTASTFFLMDEGIDSGDILSQEDVEIYETDTVRTLYDRLIETARRQILTLDINNRTPQDHSQATYMRKRIKGQEDVWLEY
jgi:methionyl-tRNA formyltransferase